MLRRATVSTIVAALMASHAMAWTNTNNGHNNQIVDGGPGAQANQAQHQTANGGAGGSASSASAGGSSSSSNALSGVGNTNVNARSAPSVFVPDGTGQAPCGGGMGLGGSVLGGGAGAGGNMWEFGDCKRLRESTALRGIAAENGANRALHDQIEQGALNELCQIGRVLDAFGGKCPSIARAKVVVDTTDYPYDYCFTRNAGDKNQHRECDKVGKSPTD